MRVQTLLAAPLLALTSAWRCGGDAGAAAAEAGAQAVKVNACELVPRQEVERLAGGTLTEVDGDFQEHTYTKPVNYTASCRYSGMRGVMLVVNYPVPEIRQTSEQMAARIATQMRSDAEDDPSLREIYGNIEVRPVAGLDGPAAEYTILNQTNLELRAGTYSLKVIAPSLEAARELAARAAGRLRS